MRGKVLYLLLLVVLAAVGSFILLSNFFFVTKADLYKDHRYIINNSLEKVEEVKDEVLLKGNSTLYVPLQLLSDAFDLKVDYDEENKIAVITTLDKVIRFYNEGIVKVNHEEDLEIPSMVIDGGRPFIPISHLEKYLNIQSSYAVETDATILTNTALDRSYVKVTEEKGRLRDEDKLFSQVLVTIPKGERLQLIENGEKWLKVLNEDGFVGYINKKAVSDDGIIEAVEKVEKASLWPKEKGKILLAWEQVHSRNPDTEEIGELKGLNVISPTWMKLKDKTGKIDDKIDTDYIRWAKGRDYQIWALLDNQFDPDLTHEFLNNATSRERAIVELLELVKDYDMDGLNIDFENVYLKDKDKLVQFVRELVPVFHDHDLVVSMDVTVKSLSENWSMFYDRKALGEVLDYMAIMAYDEHWGSSPISGSVASIGWVEKGIQGILEEVPSEKLLLGMPLYTRVWTETPKDEEVKVTSRAVGMETVNEILDKYDLEKEWDETTGQNYVEYRRGEKTNKIWIEDEVSLKLKYELIHKYDLAGAALWSRGFDLPHIWEALDKAENMDR